MPASPSFADDWVEPLLGPALNGEADYVSPSYTRALSEGTLTTNLLAPLARSLFGKRLQEVLGGCAAARRPCSMPGRRWRTGPTSRRVRARRCDSSARRWPETTRFVEVQLGRKQVDPGAAPADLAHMLVDSVGPLLRLMERDAGAWQDVRGSRARPAARTAAPPRGTTPATSGLIAWSEPSISA